jgi:hypothetical protein
MVYKTPHKRKLQNEQHELHQNSGVNSGITNSVISHERGKERIVIKKKRTCPWSFLTQIFRNGKPSHGGDVKLLKQ